METLDRNVASFLLNFTVSGFGGRMFLLAVKRCKSTIFWLEIT